ncbi:MAG: transposase [Candidatus Tectimicrobiota bacterium]
MGQVELDPRFAWPLDPIRPERWSQATGRLQPGHRPPARTALSPISRALFTDALYHAGLLEPIAPEVWTIPWNVHSQAQPHGHSACTSLAPSASSRAPSPTTVSSASRSARLQRLEQELQAPIKTWRVPPVVEALPVLSGVQCTVALTMSASVGALPRFDSPRELLSFLGLISSGYFSGERRHQGASTTAGNSHARRALGEGAWAPALPPRSAALCHCVWPNSPR